MDASRPTVSTTFGNQLSVRPAELLRRLRDPSPPIAGLLIDLCGVLYDDSAWHRWLFKLVQRLGLHTTYTPFFRVWRREYLERVQRDELEYWQALRMFLLAAGLTRGQVDEVEAAGHARRRSCESEILPLPGVVNVLTSLSDMGICLTLVSSACLGTQQVCQRLGRLGVESYFDAVLAIPDLRRADPHRPVFQMAVETTLLPAGRLAFVGRDSALLNDAGQHGLRRIAVNYDDDAVADVYLSSFDRLLDAAIWDTERRAAT